jgi:hypothetical protein
MQLVQLFLPLYDNHGQPFPKAFFDDLREQLAQQFGGVTAYVRSPAVGLWENEQGAVCHDDVILFEVMVDKLEHDWWKSCRRRLERQFSQDAILIRASAVELL